MIAVGIIDDDPTGGSALSRVLRAERDINVVYHLGASQEQAGEACHPTPDVLLISLLVPALDGTGSSTPGHAAGSPARIILITALERNGGILPSLTAGGAGFLLTTDSPTELVHAVRAVYQRTGVAARTPSGIGPPPSPRPMSGPLKPMITTLTAREQEVLGLLGHGHSNAEIAAITGVTGATVKAHVSSIMAKMGVRSRLQVVVHAYGPEPVVEQDPRPCRRSGCLWLGTAPA